MPPLSCRPRGAGQIHLDNVTFLLSNEEYEYMVLLATVSTVQVPIYQKAMEELRANFQIEVCAWPSAAAPPLSPRSLCFNAPSYK